MSNKAVFILLSLLCLASHTSLESLKRPSIKVVLLARNKEHTLPYFLTLFQQLNYPKDRLSLYVRADHSEDKTIPILKLWLAEEGHKYHSLDVVLDTNSSLYKGERSRTDFNEESYSGIMKLKEDALIHARQSWADYVLFLDTDIFITEPDVINILLAKEKPIIAPLLRSLGFYSNFWGAMTEGYWYKRSDDYLDIKDRETLGCFPVPMVHSIVLVDLKTTQSDGLTFNPQNLPQKDLPHDDIIAFAISSKNVGLEMTICNNIYGFQTPPVNENENSLLDKLRLNSLRCEIIVEKGPLPVSPLLIDFLEPIPLKKDKLDFDEIYLINLERRPDRREKMMEIFEVLRLDVNPINAVDGKKLTEKNLEELNIKFLPGYKDPWHGRLMTYGEIGCFLSHYNVWKDVVEKKHDAVLLFEDDIRFEPYFRETVNSLMAHVEDIDLDWDLIYLGRKRLKDSDEPWVEDSDKLIHVNYSYWTLCYILSYKGAKKLLDAKPLEKLVPVDEFLPIMFDKHPETDWMKAFPVRDLMAYSIAPLAVNPTLYVGQEGYFSDTEDSNLIKEEYDNSLYDSNGVNNDTITEHELLNSCAKEGNCPSTNLPTEASLGQLKMPKDEF